MGDRCLMTVTFGGTVRLGEQLDKLIEALDQDGAYDPWMSDKRPRETTREMVFAWAGQGKPCELSFDEVNYAQLDCLDTLQELDLPYQAWNGSGWEYCAGYQSWTPEDGAKEWDEPATGMVDRWSIREILKDNAPIEAVAALHELLDGMDKDEKPDIPAFRIVA